MYMNENLLQYYTPLCIAQGYGNQPQIAFVYVMVGFCKSQHTLSHCHSNNHCVDPTLGTWSENNSKIDLLKKSRISASVAALTLPTFLDLVHLEFCPLNA